MTASEPMSREELRTLAALDVFGLLDEYESNLYTRSFHHASAAVQDEILELQAKIAEHPPLVRGEEPSAMLRDQVMTAVMSAMDNESSKFAPIASIGRHRAPLATEPSPRPISVRSVYFWRAAAFVLAGSLVAVAYFFAITVQRTQLISEFALGGLTAEQAKELIGNDFAYFVDNPDCDQIVLMPSDTVNLPSTGMVYVNKATQQAFLFTVGLPSDNEQYVLRIKKNDGGVEELKTFTPNSSIFGLRLDRISSVLLASAVQWEIATLDGRTVVLRSA